jgi:hypothetical protein
MGSGWRCPSVDLVMITNESMGRTNAMCTMQRDVYLPVHSMYDALSHEGFLVEATVFT